MTLTLATAVSRYCTDAKSKLANPAASGEPEDQLRNPLETLFADLTELCGLPRAAFTAVGESSIARLKTRPDFAVTLRNALVGFVEVKAPGKGADPHKYKGHDKEQWDKLRSLPNHLYTMGSAFSRALAFRRHRLYFRRRLFRRRCSGQLAFRGFSV